MSRPKKDPLRSLTGSELQELTLLRRSQSAPAIQVARATMLLAVAGGDDYQTAARAAGRRSGDAVAHLVARFNVETLPDTPAGCLALTTTRPESGSSERPDASRHRRPTARRPGR